MSLLTLLQISINKTDKNDKLKLELIDILVDFSET